MRVVPQQVNRSERDSDSSRVESRSLLCFIPRSDRRDADCLAGGVRNRSGVGVVVAAARGAPRLMR